MISVPAILFPNQYVLFFFLFFGWGVVVLQCCVGFCCAVGLGGVPCAVQQVLISCLFCMYWCVYVGPGLPVHPAPCQFPPLVSMRLSSASVSLFLPCVPVICAILLDSTSICTINGKIII